MSYLFNHGVSTKELFTNYKQHQSNITTSITLVIKIFNSALSIILNDIISNKVRFSIPGNTSSYIDFKVYKDDDFIFNRNLGRFQDIDFIESDFMGYQLFYYIQGKAYFKEMPIYLGGEIKQNFTNRINNGEKFYTVETKKYLEYLPEIEELYPNISKSDIKKIIVLGFRRMDRIMRLSGAISIRSVEPNVVLHIGFLMRNLTKKYSNYNRCQKIRYRSLYVWNKTEFDGYYYIGVGEHEYEKFLELNKVAKVRLTFLNRVAVKVKEELYCSSSSVYIFRFKHENQTYNIWKAKWYIREPEYYGKATKGHFERSTIGWKQLIKSHETREQQYF